MHSLDSDLSWLRELQQALWPKSHKQNGIVLDVSRRLTREEQKRVVSCIRDQRLVTSLMSKGMFGGFALNVYAHEQYFETGAEFLLLLTEDHLPGPKSKPAPGCGTDEAWEFFSQFTHSKQNREWLKKYKLPAPRERSYYDY